jgi:type VI protein secretion system component VasF
LRAELNTIDPSGQGMSRAPHASWTARALWWSLPLIVLALVAALSVYGWRIHKRRAGGAA